MLLTLNDEATRYTVACVGPCVVRRDPAGHDYLVVPDPEDAAGELWLFDGILLEAVRAGEFGLVLLSAEQLT